MTPRDPEHDILSAETIISAPMDHRTHAAPLLALFLVLSPMGSALAQGFHSVSSMGTNPAVAAPAGVTPSGEFTAPAPTPAPAPAPAVAPVPAPSAGGHAFSSISSIGTSSGAAATAPAAPAVRQAGNSSFETADRIVVKKAERKMYLLRSEHIIAQYPVKLGLNPYGHKEREGDFRTPEGRYQLVRRNPRSEFFLALEVSYPNETDRARARARGVPPGGLIMIHGQPNVPRKPADYYARNVWTDGCIAVSNSDMVDIWLRTPVGVPIEIRP